MEHGLEVLLNYTWSKALDDDMVAGAFGTFFGGNPVLDPNNLKGEYGRADIDMRNRVVGTLVWQPMILEGNPWMKQGIDGFTFSGTLTKSTGVPINASMSGTIASNLSGNAASLAAADGNIYGGAMSSSSGAATTGRPPEIQRNSQAGPGVSNVDFRVTRDIPIHDKMYMEFIGESFNLFNHQIVSGENSTFASYAAPKASGCPATASVPTGVHVLGVHYAVCGVYAFRGVRGRDGHQQRLVWATPTSGLCQVLLLGLAAGSTMGGGFGCRPILCSDTAELHRHSGIDTMQRSRKWDGLAHVIEAADPGHRALNAHAEARMRHAAVAAQVEVPLEGFLGQVVLLDAAVQQLVT